MEEDVQPHIDRYYYTISQILLDHGVSGMTNRIASLSSTINMLAQMSRITISDFGDRMRKIVPLAYNPLSYLALDKVEYLSDRLSSEVTGKDVRINLNEHPGIVKAFTAISNALLRPRSLRRRLTGRDNFSRILFGVLERSGTFAATIILKRQTEACHI